MCYIPNQPTQLASPRRAHHGNHGNQKYRKIRLVDLLWSEFEPHVARLSRNGACQNCRFPQRSESTLMSNALLGFLISRLSIHREFSLKTSIRLRKGKNPIPFPYSDGSSRSFCWIYWASKAALSKSIPKTQVTTVLGVHIHLVTTQILSRFGL